MLGMDNRLHRSILVKIDRLQNPKIFKIINLYLSHLSVLVVPKKWYPLCLPCGLRDKKNNIKSSKYNPASDPFLPDVKHRRSPFSSWLL
jgi:hypothetical protein